MLYQLIILLYTGSLMTVRQCTQKSEKQFIDVAYIIDQGLVGV